MYIRTEQQAKSTPETAKEQWIMCASPVTGLYLKITPKNARSYYYRYTLMGKQRKLFLGSSPNMTLKQAIVDHVDYHKQVKSGIDPVCVRNDNKAKLLAKVDGLTLNQLYDRWFTSHCSKLSDGTQDGHKNRYNKHIKPSIGDLQAQLVTPRHILELRDSITAKGTTASSRAVVAQLGQIYSWANSELLINDNHNPAMYIKVTHEVKKGVAWSDDEVKQILEVLNSGEIYSVGYTSRMALKFIMYTAVRRSQAAMTKIEWIEFADDKNEAVIHYPAETTKTGRPFLLYCSPTVTSIIKSMMEYTPTSKYLFPSSFKGQGHMSGNHLTQCMTAVLGGLQIGGVLHSSRHTFLSSTVRLGCSVEIADSCLSHASRASATTHIYLHDANYPQQKIVWQTWSNHLNSIISGTVSGGNDNVLQLFG